MRATRSFKYESRRVIHSCCVVPAGGKKSHLCVHVPCTALVTACVGKAALHISGPARCPAVVTLMTAEEKQTRERGSGSAPCFKKEQPLSFTISCLVV